MYKSIKQVVVIFLFLYFTRLTKLSFNYIYLSFIMSDWDHFRLDSNLNKIKAYN